MHRERNAAATNGKLSIETRIGSSDDGLFRGFVISLSFWCAITFQIRIETMKDSIFGSFLNSSRVIDRYFYKDFKWRVVVEKKEGD